jgi:general secretion pathway protein A
MYLEYFGFREKPFSVTPNPRFIFLSKNHREAFAHLLYGTNNHAGFIELTGEVGTGKTTVLRTFLNQLDDDSHRTALIFNPCLSSLELLRGINREFGLLHENLSKAELLEALNTFLLEQKAAGRNVVLVIDEAQNLESEVLEQIRLISNLETETDKLIQIVLAGQPELEELLEKPELRQLTQRITVRYHLLPMDFEDTKGYIEHRLELAGGAVIFSDKALKRLFRYSGGVPRLINIACDRVLLIGYGEGSREISGAMATAAVAELRRGGRPKRFLSQFRLAALAALLVCLLVWAYVLSAARPALPVPRPQPPAAVMPSSLETLRRGFSATGESKSKLIAFNALARLWSVAPATIIHSANKSKDLESLAQQRGLRLTRFTGSLDLLLRSDTPAILEFTIPGLTGKRYLALIGTERGRLLIAPSLAGKQSLGSEELKALWSGNAYLLWKNYYKVRFTSTLGSRGWRVHNLQQLLAGAGVYDRQPSGIFDAATVGALKKYQAARGLEPDGRPGALTLISLYQEGREFATPKLGKKGESKR